MLVRSISVLSVAAVDLFVGYAFAVSGVDMFSEVPSGGLYRCEPVDSVWVWTGDYLGL